MQEYAHNHMLVYPQRLYVYKVSPHLSNGTTSSFPHFFGLCKAPSQRLKFPQDNITQRRDFYDKLLRDRKSVV